MTDLMIGQEELSGLRGTWDSLYHSPSFFPLPPATFIAPPITILWALLKARGV